MPLGCAGVTYGCAESAQNHAFPTSVHFFGTKTFTEWKKCKNQMSEFTECSPKRSGVYILISPQNCEKGLTWLSKFPRTCNFFLEFLVDLIWYYIRIEPLNLKWLSYWQRIMIWNWIIQHWIFLDILLILNLFNECQ